MTSKARTKSIQTLSDSGPKLRQTQAEYDATHPSAGPGAKPSMSSSKMYVCRRCQANFKTGEGRPDPRMSGIGKCNKCIAATAAPALAA
jgi:hypothetical protein